MIDRREFYIDGAWRAARDGGALDVVDPSTEEPFARIARGGPADTDAAVAAARGAFAGWAATPVEARREAIVHIGERYAARAEDLARTMSREMGAPIDFARSDQAGAGAKHIRGFLDAIDRVAWDAPMPGGGAGDRVLMQPVGVVALITPWNWPMNQITLKVIAALAAGCTMVLKPSELAPLSAMIFADILHEASLPPGVFNLVNGDGAGVGSALAAHGDVDMVSFTGSARGGRAVTEAAAATQKRVTLELGGKGANLVFADADADAVPRGARLCFENTGQSCNAPSRMIVQRGRYAAAVEEARATAEAQAVGPADRPGDHVGPLAGEAQFEKVQALIQAGIDEGARLVAGGPGRPDGVNRGYFARPTVFADVSPGMTIAREEIFGPVLAMMPFEDEGEAVAMANDTEYGLTNYVQTADPARARRVARGLRSGIVQMNGASMAAGAPFGGMKRSGNGREGGRWGIEDFLEVQYVAGWPPDA